MDNLKIVSFNIRCPQECDGVNFWPNRQNIVDKFLTQVDADIICLQEVVPTVKEHFILTHPEYQFFGDFRFVPQREYDETPLVGLRADKYAVLSYKRLWLSPTPSVPESKYVPETFWPRVYVELKLKDLNSGKIFYLINTHFELDNYSIGKSFKQLCARVKEIENNGYDVLLTGDLNQEYSYLKQFNDGSLTDLTSNVKYTFHSYGKYDETNKINKNGNTVSVKIDYVLSNRSDLKTNSYIAKIVENGVYVSDHFPVICEIDNF